MEIPKEAIYFFNEEIDFSFTISDKFKKLVRFLADDYKSKPGALNFIFCSDDYLLAINKEYLQHDYYTDVITFDYSEGKIFSGDIFISIDTVKNNAEQYKLSFLNELLRVMIHALLHIAGEDDKTEEEQKQMRRKEDYYIKTANLEFNINF